MSTIVVVRKGQTACIGADSMTKWGSLKESAEYVGNTDKIVKAGSSYLGICGPAAGDMVISSYFSRMKRAPSMRSTMEIFEAMRNMHPVLKEEYFMLPSDGEDDDAFEILQMGILIANPWGIFGVYEYRDVLEYKKFYAFGSGRDLALGAMHALYDSVKSAEAIAQAGLEAGAAFDDGTGKPFNLKTVRLRAGAKQG